MQKKYLFTPGPTPIPPEIYQAEISPIIHHRCAEFGALLKEVNEGLKYIFQTRNDVFVLTASGTGGMEAAVANCLSAEENALVASSGVFGDRFAEIIRTYGLQPQVIKANPGEEVKPEEIARELEKKSYSALFTTHSDTSTATATDIKAMANLTREKETLLIVDAISGLAAMELKTDEWAVDVVIAGSQKALMMPPGLVFLSVSEKAWKKIEKGGLPAYYWNLKKYREAFLRTPSETPFTPAISLVQALKKALEMIKEEGIENVILRHKKNATAVREAVKALGLELFTRGTASDAITAIKPPPGIEAGAIKKTLHDKYGITIAGGQKELKGKIFRIGHLGYMNRFDIIMVIAALEMSLADLGYKTEKGKGVQRALEILS